MATCAAGPSVSPRLQSVASQRRDGVTGAQRVAHTLHRSPTSGASGAAMVTYS